nr:site-specific integrase [Lachnospiraceae bacterium]
PFSELTVREMFEKMVEDYTINKVVSNLTLSHYQADWRKYVEETSCDWLDMPIKSVLPEQIAAHYKMLTAGCHMKQSTFRNVKTVVNAVFDYAIVKNVSCTKASNIATRHLRFAPKVDKWNGVYTDEARQKILQVCEDMKPTVYIKAIELMFCLDIRIGELRALYKEDVNLDNKTVYIGHQMIDVKTDTVNRHSERVDIMKGKQEAGKRIQPLSKRAIKVIQELFDMYPDSDWLLPSKGDNTPIRLHRFNDNLRKVCEKAGVKYFSSHGIRFHNISALYDAGIDEKEIQKLSGHTTASMTRYYNRSISTNDESDRIREVLG